MHIQTAGRKAQFITISNPITKFKEPRNIACPQIILYQLGCDLLSGEALEFEATLNFKVETLFTYTMYMYALMRIAESSVTLFPHFSVLQTSILRYCFSQLGLGLLQHRSSK